MNKSQTIRYLLCLTQVLLALSQTQSTVCLNNHTAPSKTDSVWVSKMNNKNDSSDSSDLNPEKRGYATGASKLTEELVRSITKEEYDSLVKRYHHSEIDKNDLQNILNKKGLDEGSTLIISYYIEENFKYFGS